MAQGGQGGGMKVGKAVCSAALSLVLGLGSKLAGQSEAAVGPLVGHVTEESALLWMYLPKGEEGTISYRPEGEDGGGGTGTFAVYDPQAAEVGAGRAAWVLLKGLRPETGYRYEVAVGGAGREEWSGEFKTAAVVGTPGKLRVAVTSCMKVGQPLGSWKQLLAQEPDLHLTLGDTHYADTTDPAVQWEHHLRYRRLTEFAEAIRRVPTYSMWDDHDYGPNDSDGTAKGKERSLLGWRQFWANPGAGTPEVPGAFYKFQRGEVEFFVVDGRYHRSPDKAPDDEEKRMLGDAQFAWLLEGLKGSKAKFKVIASGSTLHHSQGDGWRVYTFSRHRLFDSLKEHKISGVLYCAGDIHNSLVWEHSESERVGYPLVEVLSSGIANSKNLSFATLDFDTAKADPTVRVRIVQGDGRVSEEKEWKLSALGGGE